ncbi:disks large homolog 5-like [Peromyscus californicus insignis]|uniref:disks large homolog 5-like n=1 Tax=Peromyscus californicus insignis TaxID=564181 RepID=UPI0022A69128|nr:disks large homolog 5-like [Peromyscus californicus insignis]
MTTQRNDLRDRLILVTEGSLDNRPYHRLNPFWENIKMEHQQVMSDLQNFENENLEASQKLCELTKDKVFLCDLQSRLLMEQSQLKKKLDTLRQEKDNLLEDWDLLKHHLGDLKVLSKDQEETSGLENQQQQVGQAAGSQLGPASFTYLTLPSLPNRSRHLCSISSLSSSIHPSIHPLHDIKLFIVCLCISISGK